MLVKIINEDGSVKYVIPTMDDIAEALKKLPSIKRG